MFKIICTIVGLGLIAFGIMGFVDFTGSTIVFLTPDIREIVTSAGSIILGLLIGLFGIS